MKEMTPSMKEIGFIMLMINSFIYIPVAVYAPYISAYYKWKEINAFEIGILLAIGPIISIFVQPLWVFISDRDGQRKLILAFVAIGASLTSLLYYAGNSFLFFSVATAMYMIFNTSLIPLSDVIIIPYASEYNIDIAKIRMGGSIGYAVVAFIAGFYLKENPTAQFLMACIGYIILFLWIGNPFLDKILLNIDFAGFL